MRVTLLGVMIVVASATAGAQEDFSYARRLYLDKAQCSYCHGWAGDGAGEGQSNGGAANLRQTRPSKPFAAKTGEHCFANSTANTLRCIAEDCG